MSFSNSFSGLTGFALYCWTFRASTHTCKKYEALRGK